MIAITKSKSLIQFVCSESNECAGNGAFTARTRKLLFDAFHLLQYHDYKKVFLTFDDYWITAYSIEGVVTYAITRDKEIAQANGIDLVGSFPTNQIGHLLRVLGRK